MAMPTIVVADDDYDVRELIVMTLEDAGYTVVPAHDGLKTVQLAQQLTPALVVCDLLMPFDGTHVFQALRADARTASIPIILTTAYGRFEALPNADAILDKPFSLSFLLSLVERFVKPQP